MFVTKEQQDVVEKRIEMGYECWGVTNAQLNGLDAFLMVKGSHTMCINSLGYCEHYNGRTYSGLREVVL